MVSDKDHVEALRVKNPRLLDLPIFPSQAVNLILHSRNTLRQEKLLDFGKGEVYILDTMNGKELKRLRMALKMTQRELAEALDLNKNTVARAERDEIPIPRVTELAIKYLVVMQSKKRGKKK
jgi:DNA-binding XRE family transcriptional regulator